MALKALKPGLKTMASRLGFAPGDTKAQDRQRMKVAPWRRWYTSKRWRDLRLSVFVRDSYTCQQTGILLAHRHPHPHSPVADHIKDHNGDPDLFWDIDNIQTVSKEWHDKEKQAKEHAARHGRGG